MASSVHQLTSTPPEEDFDPKGKRFFASHHPPSYPLYNPTNLNVPEVPIPGSCANPESKFFMSSLLNLQHNQSGGK